jgi:hypothetical protein
MRRHRSCPHATALALGALGDATSSQGGSPSRPWVPALSQVACSPSVGCHCVGHLALHMASTMWVWRLSHCPWTQLRQVRPRIVVIPRSVSLHASPTKVTLPSNSSPEAKTSISSPPTPILPVLSRFRVIVATMACSILRRTSPWTLSCPTWCASILSSLLCRS